MKLMTWTSPHPSCLRYDRNTSHCSYLCMYIQSSKPELWLPPPSPSHIHPTSQKPVEVPT